MKLHEDRYSFIAILNRIHDTSKVRTDILEKDYYVTLMLRELADMQYELPAYFKGGTALYKALKSIRRFSEDIDLTVSVDNCNSNQAKKRLEAATKKYRTLPRTSEKHLEDDRKGSITAVYDYSPVVTVDEGDPLQRFSHVKIEATSFTVSEPVTDLEIEPMIYTSATEEQRRILADDYNLNPFKIKTIRLERIFVDKIIAAEFYYDRGMYFDTAKHVYDVSVMLDMPIIQSLLGNPSEMQEMINYKRLEETRRIGSDLAEKSFSDYCVFEGISNNDEYDKAFQMMQQNYVFREEDVLSKEHVVRRWNTLRETLNHLFSD